MIQARELTKRYGDTTAVHSLSFTIAPGTVTGFLGPNGAGKSTTMRMIMGLDRPTSGTVTVNGKPYRQHRAPYKQNNQHHRQRDLRSLRGAVAHRRNLDLLHPRQRRRSDPPSRHRKNRMDLAETPRSGNGAISTHGTRAVENQCHACRTAN